MITGGEVLQDEFANSLELEQTLLKVVLEKIESTKSIIELDEYWEACKHSFVDTFIPDNLFYITEEFNNKVRYLLENSYGHIFFGGVNLGHGFYNPEDTTH